MSRIFASSAASRLPGDTARPGLSRLFPHLRGLASGLASIMSHMRRREERRTSAQAEAIKNMALLQARKAILAHRKQELISQIAGARARHGATSSLIAELQRVNLEILAIG